MTDTSGKDWFAWHEPYEVAASALAVRLGLVQRRIGTALDEAPTGPIRVVSLCAGQGRDVIGAVAGHPRRDDVRARLVELDARNTEVARRLAAAAELDIEVVTADASRSEAYAGAVPARLVVACGIFGNITDEDIHNAAHLLPMLCDEGATVVWTRHRREPDLTPSVRRWFEEAGFEDLGVDAPPEHKFVTVGAARWSGPAGVPRDGVTFFTFVGDPH
ncbi:MAG: SAM-dependent methyltransferase [Acidimicrobiales bacterium]